MKAYLLFILLICTTLQAQNNFSQKYGNQIDYFKSNPKDLFDENNYNIFNSIEPDSTILTGEATQNYFGFSVSTAGDVNGDGFKDIIVGATNNNAGGTETGRSYIYLGGSSMDNIADITFTGIAVQDHFGFSVSTAGDVNGDGFSDVIVGAIYNDAGGNNAGRAYIYYGGSSMNNVADVILTGEWLDGQFGYSVSGAGDVNGDGFSDVIIGDNNYNTHSPIGRAFIYYGGSPMNNIPDFTLTGRATYDHFGIVSVAGDVNGDGFSDVIVGAYGNSDYKGRAYIYFGGPLISNDPNVTLTGEVLNDFFGYSISNAGDINRDGYSDVIVGAWGYNNYRGRTYVFYGGVDMNNEADVIMSGESLNNRFGYSLSDACDVNGDGYSDVLVGATTSLINRVYIYFGGSPMNSIADKIINRDLIDEYGFSISGAGDVNGDGLSDVLVGNRKYNANTGRAYLFTNIFPIPILISPGNNSITNPININFTWKKLNPIINYVLLVSYDSLFNNIIVNDTLINDTSKIITGFLNDTKYFWKVISKDSFNITYSSSVWNFTTIPPIYINLKMLFEGIFSSDFNQLIRKDSVTAYIHQSSPPFNIIDSAKSIIDSNSFSGLCNFYNTTTGTYYISIKHLNSIETWSKSGGELLATDGSTYNYDFTTSNTQAYGNNLKLKGSKYCLYSGDINQDGYITLFDVIPIYNDASGFVTGRFIKTDLTGDNIVDLTDVTLCYNNSTNFIRIRQP